MLDIEERIRLLQAEITRLKIAGGGIDPSVAERLEAEIMSINGDFIALQNQVDGIETKKVNKTTTINGVPLDTDEITIPTGKEKYMHNICIPDLGPIFLGQISVTIPCERKDPFKNVGELADYLRSIGIAADLTGVVFVATGLSIVADQYSTNKFGLGIIPYMSQGVDKFLLRLIRVRKNYPSTAQIFIDSQEVTVERDVVFEYDFVI